jgi:alpha-D-xyloside xylohydrolase
MLTVRTRTSGPGTQGELNKMEFSRRALGKALAASGTVAGFSRFFSGEASGEMASENKASWKTVYPGVWRATLGTPEHYTPVSSRLVEPRVSAFGKLPHVDSAPLPDVAGRRLTRGYVVRLPLRPGEEVYGLGLQLLSFAQRGKRKVTRVNADPRMDTGDSHAPVPFYVTTEGIGILVDTARYTDFYFGDARPKPIQPLNSVNPANPAPNYTQNRQ